MKTITVTLIALFLSTGFFANANNILDPSSKDARLFKKISRIMEFQPIKEVKLHENATVTVDFNVTEEGKIVVNEINGHPELSNYVKTKLESLEIKGKEPIPCNNFLYKFVFKSQQI